MSVFDTRQAALAYIAAQGLHATPYGLRSNGKDRYEIRVVAASVARTAPVARAAPKANGTPTAKSICLSLYTPGMERDAFIAAAAAAGVKEVTARTMYSDIKAGRVK